jgi:hypothetical protein
MGGATIASMGALGVETNGKNRTTTRRRKMSTTINGHSRHALIVALRDAYGHRDTFAALDDPTKIAEIFVHLAVDVGIDARISKPNDWATLDAALRFLVDNGTIRVWGGRSEWTRHLSMDKAHVRLLAILEDTHPTAMSLMHILMAER